MDKSSSLQFINKIFSFPFNEVNFSNFSHNIFDNINTNESTGWISNSSIPNDLKPFVNQYKILGTYNDKNNGRIIISMIKLIDRSVVEKSRYVQRDFSKWLLNKFNADACLVSFFSDDYEDWRFSLVTINYTREITKSGKLKATENISPLKRYSYLVGKNEPNHTAQSQLSPLLLSENRNPTIRQITDAFSVEKVTKSFYEDYVEVFNKVESFLKKKTKLDKKEIRIFTQTLFNRLMFIRFLEKKNWLKFNNTNKYLFSLYKAGNFGKMSFYKGRLKSLFFLGLGKEGFNEGVAYGKVCFLNGGLFEENKLDHLVDDLPNDLFSDILNDDGLFYKYNFTVEESTPIDIQVSVDPEMLGKVFEELINSRESTGAFYTPREVVSFMCKESLKRYFNESEFIDEKKFQLNSLDKYKSLLSKIKILDPACGSGAYLVTMLNELVNLNEQIYKKEKNKNYSKYELKLLIIQNNLYGVDIDEVAIQIARLRLWLSLIVDYNGKKPEPLPNLDFKIEKGDSLQSMNVEAIQPDIFFNSMIKEFEVVKSKYQSAKTQETKKKLLKEINAIKKNISTQYGNKNEIFEWRVEFAEVFSGELGAGFDIILANPPYGIKIEDSLREKYVQKEKLSKDIYAYFILRGLDLLKENGVLCYIVLDTWRTLKSFEPLRNRLLNYNIIHYIDLPQWIFDATVNTNIITLQKNKKDNEIITAKFSNSLEKNWELLNQTLKNISKQNIIETSNEKVGIYKINKEDIKNINNNRFVIGNSDLYKIFNNNNYEALGYVSDIKVGLQTGDNKFYIKKNNGVSGSYDLVNKDLILDNKQIEQLNDNEKEDGINKSKSNKYFVPYDKGGDSDASEGWLPNYFVPHRYFIDWSKESVNRLKTYTVADFKKDNNLKHKIKLSDKKTTASVIRNPHYYFKNGISYSSLGIYAPTFRVGNKVLFDQKSCLIKSNKYSHKMLLGILCSKIIRFFSRSFITHTTDFQVESAKLIRLPNLNDKQKEKIITLVIEIIKKQKKNSRYDFFNNEQIIIDNIVNKGFGLSTSLINEIDTWHKRTYPKLFK